MKLLNKFSAAIFLASVSAIGISGAASATTLTYSNFSDASNLQLNGTAKTVNSNGQTVLRLTDQLAQSASAFSKTAISLDNNASFSTAFQFLINNPQGIGDEDGQGADGIVFAVQTVSNTAGGGGGGIGYSGIPKSVGIEFDTYNNLSIDDFNGNHVGININGNNNSVVQRTVTPRLNNGGLWNAWVDYNGDSKNLEVRLSQAGERPIDAFLAYNVDLVSVLGSTNAFVGFTSGTGGGGNNHDILAWQFNSTYKPIDNIPKSVPEPTSLFTILGLGALGTTMLKRKRTQKA